MTRRSPAPVALAVAALALTLLPAAPALAQEAAEEAEVPSVTIVEPQDGARVLPEQGAQATVTIELAVENYELGPDLGHVHVSVVPEYTFRGFNETDDEGPGEGAALGRPTVSTREVSPENGTIPAEELITVGRWVRLYDTNVTIVNVPPQEYVVRAHLAGPDHEPVPAEAAVAQTNFTVAAPGETVALPGEPPEQDNGVPLPQWAAVAALLAGAAALGARRGRGE